MKDCNFYKEEAPFFRSTGIGGVEVEMIPVCTRPGIQSLGEPSDFIPCEGILEKCPFKDQK